tara:strand:+ start:107 stop:298 length:192 start_codon:yes stop_codon:yes gene_type:complete
MAYRKLSSAQIWRLFLISLTIGMVVGIYYLLSPYQQCRREIRIEHPNTEEQGIIDECLERTTN